MNGRILALLLALSGCGDASDEGAGSTSATSVPGCEHIDHEACDIREGDCQARLFELTACLRAEAGATMPPVSRMTPAQYAELLNASAASTPRPNPDHVERAFSLLRLVEPGALSPQTVRAEHVESVAGVYRSDTDEIIIIDRPASGAREHEQASALLVHEFVHALQDQSVDLPAWYAAHASPESAVSLRAVTEGEASLHADRYRAALSGIQPRELAWRERYDAIVARDELRVRDERSPFANTSWLFPYGWGTRYMNLVWQSGGLDAVLQRFEAPPLTTYAVLASSEDVVRDPSPTEPAEPVPTRDWALVTDGVLGAWGAFLVFSRAAARIDDARTPALAWRGDHVWVYRSTSPADLETAVVWKLELADEASAAGAEVQAVLLMGPERVGRRGTTLIIATATASPALDWAF